MGSRGAVTQKWGIGTLGHLSMVRILGSHNDLRKHQSSTAAKQEDESLCLDITSCLVVNITYVTRENYFLLIFMARRGLEKIDNCCRKIA